MNVIGGKWTPVILSHLKQQPLRFSQLSRLIPDITEKMLTQRLRSLEADGIVNRTVVGNTPPHVRYDLSDAGHSLGSVLQALYDWGGDRAAALGLAIEPINL